MPSNDSGVQREIRNNTIKEAWKKLVYSAGVFVAGAALVYFVSARPHKQSYWKQHKEYMELSETNSVLKMENTILKKELESIIENSKEQRKDSPRTYEDQQKTKPNLEQKVPKYEQPREEFRQTPELEDTERKNLEARETHFLG